MYNQFKGMAYSAYATTANYASSAYDTTSGYVAGAYTATTNFARGAYDTTTTYAKGAYDTSVNFAKGAYDKTASYATGAYDTSASYAKGAYDKTTSYARSAYDTTTTYAKNAYQRASDFSQTAFNTAAAYVAEFAKGFQSNANPSPLLAIEGPKDPFAIINSTIPLERLVQCGSLEEIFNPLAAEFALHANPQTLFGLHMHPELANQIKKLQREGCLKIEAVEGASYNGNPAFKVSYQPEGGSVISTVAAFDGQGIRYSLGEDELEFTITEPQIVDLSEEQGTYQTEPFIQDEEAFARTIETSKQVLESTNYTTGNFVLMGLGVAMAVAGACIAALTSMLAVGAAVTGVGLLVAGYGLFNQVNASKNTVQHEDVDDFQHIGSAASAC